MREFWNVVCVHRIAPPDVDKGEVEIPGGAWASSRTLAAALRDAGVLAPGTRLRGFRTEPSGVVLAFPDRGWHCVRLTFSGQVGTDLGSPQNGASRLSGTRP